MTTSRSIIARDRNGGLLGGVKITTEVETGDADVMFLFKYRGGDGEVKKLARKIPLAILTTRRGMSSLKENDRVLIDLVARALGITFDQLRNKLQAFANIYQDSKFVNGCVEELNEIALTDYNDFDEEAEDGQEWNV